MAIENKVLTFGGNKIATVGGNSAMGFRIFTPNIIPNCILWLDNSEDNFIKDIDNKISQWSDKSGLNHHFTQISGGSQPLFVANGINGKNGVYFSNSVNNFLNCTFSEVYAQVYTIITVWNLDINSNQVNPVVYDSLTVTNRTLLYWFSNNIRACSPNFIDAYAKTRPFNLISNLIEYNNTDTQIFENGILKATKNTGADTLEDMRLGNIAGTVTSGARLSGYICEHIIYSRALNTEEKAEINDYLNTKYGL